MFMNKRNYELLVESTRDVFETMSFMEVIQNDPITVSAEIPGIDITAVICIAGEISGMLGVHCSKQFAAECFDMMTGGEGGAPSYQQLCDTVGELANMIAGTLKRRMSSKLDLFDLSLPSISVSSGQRLFYTGAKDDFPRLLVPFVLANGEKFYVELLYHRR